MSAFSLSHMHIPLLSLIIWLPIGSLFFLLLLPSSQQQIFRHITLGTALLQGLGIGLVLMHGLDDTPVERFSWMRLDLGNLGVLSVDYLVGIDGLSIGLILLSSLILTMGVIGPVPTYGHPNHG